MIWIAELSSIPQWLIHDYIDNIKWTKLAPISIEIISMQMTQFFSQELHR